MLNITRWFIKAGIIYLVLGMFLVFIDSTPWWDTGVALLPVYWHMIVVGWITQIIMGVSIWMFPRKRRDQPKRENLLVWSAFWTLNAGLILRFVIEPFLGQVPENSLTIAVVGLSAILQLTGVICYVIEIWPRVQPKRAHKRR